MTPDLDQAVEQVRDVLQENCEGRFDERAVVEALLAAGWRPPEVTDFVWTQFEDWTMRVDPKADMGYIRIRDLAPGEHIDCTDRSYKTRGVLIDRDANGQILGLEVFLRKGQVRPETVAVIRRLLSPGTS